MQAKVAVEKLLTIKEGSSMVGFKKSTLYKKIRDGTFPRPLKIGTSSRWKLSEIQKWIENPK